MKIKKLIRYIYTGYIFQLRNIYIKLKEFEGENWVVEKDIPDLKIAVYTVIFGDYDNIIEPITYKNIDFYIITNRTLEKESKWIKINVESEPYLKGMNDQEKSRYFKIHPEKIFSNYEYSVYIDGNIKIEKDITCIVKKMHEEGKIIGLHKHYYRNCIYKEGNAIIALGKASYRDVKKHLKKYKKEGFPRNFGLFENNIIIRKHNDENCIKVMDTWWTEYINGCKRDQLSFVYSLWKNGYTCDFVKSLGSNSRFNPYFSVVNHKKDK